MICTGCGKQIADSSVFCPLCGAQQAAPRPGQQAPQQAAAPQQPAPPPPQQAAPPMGYSAPARVGPAAAQPAGQPGPQAAPMAAPGAPSPVLRPTGPAPVLPALMANTKTGMDVVAGAAFLVLGLFSLAAYGYLTVTLGMELIPQLGDVFSSYGFVGLFTNSYALAHYLSAIILLLGFLLGAIGGLTLVCGGISSLTSGRGRKASYGAVTLSLLAALFGFVVVLVLFGSLSDIYAGAPAFGELFLLAHFFALPELVSGLPFWVLFVPALLIVIVVSILLIVKRSVKRKKMNQHSVNVPPPPPMGAVAPAPTTYTARPAAPAQYTAPQQAPVAPAPMPAAPAPAPTAPVQAPPAAPPVNTTAQPPASTPPAGAPAPGPEL